MSDQKIVNMAEAAPALPPKEEIVTNEVLIAGGRSSLSLAQAFAGQANPTTIWQSMIGDRQDAYFFYRELEEKDTDVSGRIEELKLAVLSRERQVTPFDDSSQADNIASFVKEQLAAVKNFHQVLKCLLDAPFYGVSIAEILFDVSAGQVGLLDIKDRPQELFSFNPFTQPQIGALRFLRNRFDTTGGELVPPEKFLVYTHDARSGNRRGRPLLRRVFWPSWFKRNALRFWLRFAEKGPGTAAVTYQQGATPDEKKQALAAAEAMINITAIAVPENFGLIKELLTGARSQNPAAYYQLVANHREEIARIIVGQTLTSQGSEGGSGSRALGDVHAETKEQRVEELAMALETVINDQLIKNLVLWNFGPNAPAPKWSIAPTNTIDLRERSLIDRTLQIMGMKIPEHYVAETYGIPQPEGDDDVLTSEQAQFAQLGIRNGGADPTQPSGGGFGFSDESKDVKKGVSAVDELLNDLKQETKDLFKQRARSVAATVGGRR